MSKQCLNCGREISGVGNNKIFCDDCFRLIASFLQEIRSENAPAVSVFEKNRDRIAAAGVSEAAIDYIGRCCVRYDAKKGAAAPAAASAAASAASAPARQQPPRQPQPERIERQQPPKRQTAAPVGDPLLEEMPDPFAAVRDSEKAPSDGSSGDNIKAFSTADFNAISASTGRAPSRGAQQPQGRPAQPQRPVQPPRAARKVYDFDADTSHMDDEDDGSGTSVFIPVQKPGSADNAPVTPDPDSFDAALYAGNDILGPSGSSDGSDVVTAQEDEDELAVAFAPIGAGYGASGGRRTRGNGSVSDNENGGAPQNGGDGGDGSGGGNGGNDGDDEDDDESAKRRLILICLAAGLALILFVIIVVQGFMNGGNRPIETDGGSTDGSSQTNRPNTTTAPSTDLTGPADTGNDTDANTEHTEHTWLEATCTEARRCAICGVVDGEPLGHDYGEPQFTWTNSNRTCTATFTCKRDASHTETVDAVIESQTSAPSCTEAGVTTYTATASFNGQTYTNTTESLPSTAPGHDWDVPEFKWSSDYTSCTVTFTCKRDKTHTETLDATITSRAGEGSVCTGAESTIYTATVTHEGSTFSDNQTVTTSGTAAGHDWDTPTFTWSEDNKTCTVKFVCKRDSTHTETVEAKITVSDSSATCTEAGSVTYTATATLDGKDYTDTKSVPADALGHDWEATFEWADDHTCKVTFICKHDNSHKETVNANVGEPTDVKDATCTEPGSATYTAAVEFEGKTYTDTKKYETPALGHDYTGEDPTVCKRCKKSPASILGVNDSGKVYETELEVLVTKISGDPTTEPGINNLTIYYSVENKAEADGKAYEEGGFRLYLRSRSTGEITFITPSGLGENETIAPTSVVDRVVQFKFKMNDYDPLFLEYRSSNYKGYTDSPQLYSDKPEAALYWVPPKRLGE